MDLITASTAFMVAASWAERVMRDPAVGDHWDEPSALARMEVGALAGHLYLVVRRVDQHLDVEPPPVSAPTGRYPVVRIDQPADLDADVHQRVRSDGRHVAQRGWCGVRDAYADRVQKLSTRLTGPLPSTIQFGAGSIDFAEYLSSRVVEVLVHADDLAASVGLEPPDPPAACVDVGLEFAVRVARGQHGDMDVLRAFTRRERVRGSVPAIF